MDHLINGVIGKYETSCVGVAVGASANLNWCEIAKALTEADDCPNWTRGERIVAHHKRVFVY